MRKVLIFFFFFVFLIVASGTAFGARPLVTDDFGVVDFGKYEFEFGYNSETLRIGGDSSSSFAVQIKRGFGNNFDFGIELPYSSTPPSGLADIILHAKLKLLEQNENDGLTARVDAKLSNGNIDDDLGSGYNDYTAMVIYSKMISDIKTHYNLSYTIVGVPSGAPESNTVNYAAAMEKEVVAGVDLVSEYYGSSSTLGALSNIQVGGRWQAFEALRFDAGYSIALNDNSENIATVGITTEF